MQATSQILVRVVIAKVTDRDRLISILRSVPVVQNDPEWNCVIWVKGALEALQKDGKATGTAKLDWQKVRDFVMDYVQRKKDGHRFDVKGNFQMRWPATYDLLEDEEVIE